MSGRGDGRRWWPGSSRLVPAAPAEAGVKVEAFSGVAGQRPGAGVIAAVTEPRHLMVPAAVGNVPAGPARYLP